MSKDEQFRILIREYFTMKTRGVVYEAVCRELNKLFQEYLEESCDRKH